MDSGLNRNASNKWLSVPLIATVTRILCRELTLPNEYLRQENKILKSEINTRISFNEDERVTQGHIFNYQLSGEENFEGQSML